MRVLGGRGAGACWGRGAGICVVHRVGERFCCCAGGGLAFCGVRGGSGGLWARSVAFCRGAGVREFRRVSDGVSTMSAAEIAEFVGLLFGAWAVGFCGGYLLTRFREAASQV